MKYNYVVFATNKDYYRYAFKDIEGLKNVKVLWTQIDSRSEMLQKLNRIHFSDKLNKRINIPLKNIWMPLNFKNEFNDSRPLCFVYFGSRKNVLRSEYIQYLKKKYPGSRHVIYFLDLIKTTHSVEQANHLINLVDLVYSYDISDARNYRIYYQHELYSTNKDINTNQIVQESDVYFLGKAKTRLDIIRSAYQLLTKKGLKCDFYIIGAGHGSKNIEEGIHFIDVPMSYSENVSHVKQSKAVLEIVQEGAEGSTLRCCEAICYNKLLITNNPQILKEPFYSPEKIKYFNTIGELSDFSPNGFKSIYSEQDLEYLSPLKFLLRIDEAL